MASLSVEPESMAGLIVLFLFFCLLEPENVACLLTEPESVATSFEE